MNIKRSFTCLNSTVAHRLFPRIIHASLFYCYPQRIYLHLFVAKKFSFAFRVIKLAVV